MTLILAIDPGTTESGYALVDSLDYGSGSFAKVSNEAMAGLLRSIPFDRLDLEMIRSYGMPVGAEVFETCVWIGRFMEIAERRGVPVTRHYRDDVRRHFCRSAKAKDSNVIQALIDRFAPGVPNRGKGSKAEPGWFYGFAGDVWQAYALGVFTADGLNGLT